MQMNFLPYLEINIVGISFLTRTQHKTFILHGMYIPDFKSTHISLTTYFTTIFFDFIALTVFKT